MNLTNTRARLLSGAALGLGMMMLAAQPARADSVCGFSGTSTLPPPVIASNCGDPNGNGNLEVTGAGVFGINLVDPAAVVSVFASPTQVITTGYIESTTANRGVVRILTDQALIYTGTGSTLVAQPTATNAVALAIVARNVTLTSGTLTALGVGSGALSVTADGGAGSGGITATLNGSLRGGNGAPVVSFQQTNATATGNILVTGNSGSTITTGGGNGIQVTAAGSGNITIDNSMSILGAGGSVQNGIVATTTGTGSISLNQQTGAIGITANRAQGVGLLATINNVASAGTITVTSGAGLNTVGDSISASTSGTGAIGITSTGGVDSSAGIGIHAVTAGGGITIGAGSIIAGNSAILAQQGNSAGAGAIAITTGNAAVTGATGIRANNTGLGGTTVTTGAGLITGTGGYAIHADLTNAASTANLAVNVGAGGATSATTAVLAQNFGTGTLSVSNTGAVTSTGAEAIRSIAGAGNQTITAGANVIGATFGIYSTSTSGNIAVNVTGGTTTGANDGIVAQSTSGTVAVNVTGGNVIGTGAGANGILVSSSGAMTINIGAGRSVTAPATGGFAILTGGTGTVLVNNSGTFGTAGSVALFNGGFTNANTVNNLAGGTMNGRVDLGNLVDVINNTGTWNASGVNRFYLGTDVVTNNTGGIINTATGTTFDGLETWTNAGTTNTTGTLGFTGVATALTNSGTFNLGAASAVTGLGTVTSSGAMNAAAGSSLSNTGNFTNSGTLTTAGAFSLASTGTVLNSGTLVLAPAVFTLTGATAFNNTGAIRAEGGASTITSALTLNNTGGLDLQDGATNDVLTITGNYNGGAGAALLLDYGGTTADRLVIGGNATGTTNIQFTALPNITGIDTNGVLVVDMTGTAAANAFTTTSVLNGLVNLSLQQRGADFFVVGLPNQAAFTPLVLGNIVQEAWYPGAQAFRDNLVDRGEMRERSWSLWLQPYYSNDKAGDSNTTFTTLGQAYTVPTRIETERWGFQGGADFNVGGADLGVTAGWQSANAENGFQDLTGWNIGAYALYGSGPGFYGNLLVKYDSDQVDTGFGFETDADSIGGDLDLGYKLTMGGPVTLDLNAGFSYVDTSIDDFTQLGITYTTGSLTSARGRVGLRAVFEEMSGMFAGAHVYHEFDGETALTLDSTTDAFAFNESRGTWATVELGVGANDRAPVNVSAWIDIGDVHGWGLTAGARF